MNKNGFIYCITHEWHKVGATWECGKCGESTHKNPVMPEHTATPALCPICHHRVGTLHENGCPQQIITTIEER